MWKVGKGQSLVEVVIVAGMMSLLIIALLALVSLSLRNNRLAKDRAQAVTLAQEGIELMRAYRDYSWSEFAAMANGNDYLLPKNWVVENSLNTLCNQDQLIYDYFWRCTQLSISNGDVEVKVRVGWHEGAREMSTVQITRLSLWER